MPRLATLLLLVPLAGFAQVDQPPFDRQGRPNRNQPGPWDNDVLVYRVTPDGRATQLGTFERAGVPTAARLSNGRLIAAHQQFPADNGAVRPAGQGGARPREGAGYHATSRDGLNFTRAKDVQIDGRGRWLGNAQSVGAVITFFGTDDPGVRMAASSDGQNWKTKARLSRELQGADSGAVRLREGSWLVIATGPPRPGTPSARGHGRSRPEPRGSEPSRSR